MLQLSHDDLLPFIQRRLNLKTRSMQMFALVIIIFIVHLVWDVIRDFSAGTLTWNALVFGLLLGLVASFTLIIPIHEGIHGIAYKILGATKVTLG